jgi:hypothetical protein
MLQAMAVSNKRKRNYSALYMMSTINELSDEELITLEGLVTNERVWGLLKKMYQRRIADFWDRLRLTDPSDEVRVSANHKLAVGVEASLGAMVQEIEEIVKHRQYKSHESEVIDDQTKVLFQ